MYANVCSLLYFEYMYIYIYGAYFIYDFTLRQTMMIHDYVSSLCNNLLIFQLNQRVTIFSANSPWTGFSAIPGSILDANQHVRVLLERKCSEWASLATEFVTTFPVFKQSACRYRRFLVRSVATRIS